MSTAALVNDAPATAELDIRPRVAAPQSRIPVYLFGAGLAVLAVSLFSALNARREALTSPETRPLSADLARGTTEPPALFVPPAADIVEVLPRYRSVYPPSGAYLYEPRSLAFRDRGGNANDGLQVRPGSDGGVRITQPPLRVPPLMGALQGPTGAAGVIESGRASTAPVLVIDVGNGQGAPVGTASGAATANNQASGVGATQGPSRIRSGRLANPTTTVPQGTSIPAVLETALDSTRPGQARAVVSMDVRGFDGRRVLIPRGSRLYGEYAADLETGQNRALIQWTRLLRPDGVIIAIGSPAADSLGRAGVRGRVNNHFFQKFFSAILQSSLDIGVGLATRSVDNGGVVLLPGSIGQTTPRQQEIKPTLKVKQGRSIAVLVARDLDFGSASGR